MSSPASGGSAQRRFVQLIVAAGLVGAVLMSLAMTNTLSSFVASITNDKNSAATGTLILQESGAGGSACNSTDGTGGSINTNAFATCSTFNKYGGSTTMVPSNGTTNTVATTVNFKSTGTATATATSFTVRFGACESFANGATTNGSATDFCSKLRVKVVSGGTTVVGENTAAGLDNTTVTIPAALVPSTNAGTPVPFTFTTWIDSSAGNTHQGLGASQPITWTLTS